MFKKILIANRGEIACRVIKTREAHGHRHRRGLFRRRRRRAPRRSADEAVRIGPPPSAESYLVIDKIIAACRETGAEAVHPGLRLPVGERGLRRGAREGGDRLHRPRRRGDRGDGRQDRVEEAGHATPASRPSPAISTSSPTPSAAVEIARDIGYPVMIKASAGGGGKGMRVARNDEEAREGFRSATQRGEVELRRRPRLHREIHRGAAPHRDPGARATATATSSISASANARSSAATRR